MTIVEAKNLFGSNFIGPEELGQLSRSIAVDIKSVPEIPFVDDILVAHAATHLLIFIPSHFADGTSITINALRERLGMDPAVSEPCMYNQDWYVKEDFAAVTTPDNGWHLIAKQALNEARAKQPGDIESSLPSTEVFPSAITLAFAFFAYWYATGGEKLWVNDFLWCSDRDHNDDRIYVGRYEDPSGVNKNGFNIHRHLALRPAYSVAPEILA